MSFILPDLPYDFSALEPHIDSRTMEIHHDKHHNGYVTKLNAAVQATEYADWPIEKILGGISTLPEQIQTAVRNNGGGHANHSLFWQIMTPDTTQPAGSFVVALENDLGGYESFWQKFEAAALGRFGSGWAWLVVNSDRKLEVISTANQDSPLIDKKVPIIGLDVWEHAYYLNYQNRRPDYVKAFVHLVNWKEAGKRYEEAMG